MFSTDIFPFIEENRTKEALALIADPNFDPNVQKEWEDEIHESAIISACNYGNIDIVHALIRKGADVNGTYDTKSERSNYGNITKYERPLHVAISSGCNDIVKLFLANGVDAEARSYIHGWTALHFAASSNKPDIVELLFDRSSYNLSNWLYSNLSHWVNNSYSELIEAYISPSPQNKNILEIAHTATKIGACALSSRINPIAVDRMDANGETALVIALRLKNFDVANILLSKGASVFINNNDGKNALSYLDGNLPHTTRYLLEDSKNKSNCRVM